MALRHLTIAAMIAAAALVAGVAQVNAQSPAPQGKAPAYYIAEFEVTDREGLKPYAEQVDATFKPYSGRYIVRGGTTDRLEGNPPINRMVVIAFDSLEQARAWYNSPEYAKIRPIRQRSGHTNSYIVEGMPN
ncbi:DUF1330 domain-containing protein [Rhizobium anhuiense]|uniref:DUF1330 domain-containing protein n=1 Tax=Rhizobium anhuiense TaxID=1184720 RepID=UPI001AEC8571|nr:DUF1330 domain-containing protein [Rhizobium anhuiense]